MGNKILPAVNKPKTQRSDGSSRSIVSQSAGHQPSGGHQPVIQTFYFASTCDLVGLADLEMSLVLPWWTGLGAAGANYEVWQLEP